MRRDEYWHSEIDHPLSMEEVRNQDKEAQIEIMKDWFLHNYENPAENTPHDSGEGGYIYIWGGPYDAREILQDEFGHDIQYEVIEELVKKLESESWEWAKIPRDEDFEDYYASVVVSNTLYHEAFQKTIADITALLENCHSTTLKQTLLKMLHVHIITALETYLSDAFINTVMKDSSLIRKLVESDPEFKNNKLCLQEIFERMDKLNDEIREYLLKTLWHNLEKVKKMYKSTLGIDFPADTSDISKAIATRHDIVHRSGKNKKGVEINLSEADLRTLMDKVKELVDSVDTQLKASPYFDVEDDEDVEI